MSWKDLLKCNSLDWLLDEEDPGVRYLALRDLAPAAEGSPELSRARMKAYSVGPIGVILDAMNPSGYWDQPGSGYNAKYRSTVWSIILLAQLGAAAHDDERILRACRYYLDEAFNPGGQISTRGAPSGTVDCLQGNMCWALLELGFEDLRLEAAFDWMARTVTGEGIASSEERNAPVRYYAGKCGPTFACGANNRLPCAWGAVKVMMAFGKLPQDQRTPLVKNAIRHGVDFLLSTDPAKAGYPSGYAEKPSGNWWKFGFPVFYITDLLQIVEAFAFLGFGKDERLRDAISLILDKQDSLGRWPLEYEYNGKTWVDFGEKKQPNKWVTLRVLRVLRAIYPD